MDKQKLMNQLMVMRVTLDSIFEEVLKMQDQPQCDHPEEKRTNLTTMGAPEEWRCECGYHFKEGEE